MNHDELKEIKRKIYAEERIKELLIKMECSDIKLRNNRYEAMLPEKFDSDNSRSVQVYISESLPCRVRSKGVSNIDIFHLVSYIVFDKYSIEEMNRNLPRSKEWICEQLGYDEFLDEFFREPPKVDHLKWLHDLKRKREKSRRNLLENDVYNEEILNLFIMYPWLGWLEEGIRIGTQKHFQVGFDPQTERVIFPVRNKNGELIGIKGRYVGSDKHIEDNYKYIYIPPYTCNKSIELFNLNNALPYIQEKKEVLVFEGAKTTFLLWEHGIKNTVSIEGSDISPEQIKLLKELGVDVTHIYAWDKGKDLEFVKGQVGHIRTRTKIALIDKLDLFEDKESPMDRGIETFWKLYNECKIKL